MLQDDNDKTKKRTQKDISSTNCGLENHCDQSKMPQETQRKYIMDSPFMFKARQLGQAIKVSCICSQVSSFSIN